MFETDTKICFRYYGGYFRMKWIYSIYSYLEQLLNFNLPNDKNSPNYWWFGKLLFWFSREKKLSIFLRIVCIVVSKRMCFFSTEETKGMGFSMCIQENGNRMGMHLGRFECNCCWYLFSRDAIVLITWRHLKQFLFFCLSFLKLNR